MRPPSSARAALLATLAAGYCGTYRALADKVGVPHGTARAALKELSRAGHASAGCRQRQSGRPGAAPAVYAAYQAPLDPLGFVRQAWR